jgi:RHS repeat-associated protein
VEGPFKYDPYGNCFAGSNPCSAGEPYRFTGRRFDAETGLYYYRARYYDPQKGRFLQTDPVGYSADMNLYTYVGNDPTDATDPTGKYTCTPSGDGKTENCTSTGIPDAIVMHVTIAINNAYVNMMTGGKGSQSSGNSSSSGDDKKSGSSGTGPKGPNDPKNTPPPPGTKPANMSPQGSGRSGAFNAAKSNNGVPRSQQPSETTYNRQTGQRTYTYDKAGGGRTTIRDDARGHQYSDDPSQNRGSHFNDESGNHYDYGDPN